MWKAMPETLSQHAGPDEQQLTKLGRELLTTFGVSASEIVPTPSDTGFTRFTYTNELVVGAPWPVRSLADLFILAHQVGHVRLHVRRDANGWYRLSDQPRYLLEFEAEYFAEEWFAKRGLPIPEQVIIAARANVRTCIMEALIAGETEIDADAISWAQIHASELGDWTREVASTGTLADLAAQADRPTRCELGLAPGPWRFNARRVGISEMMVGICVVGVAVAVWARLPS